MNLLIVEVKRNELLFATFRRKRGVLSFVEATRHHLGHEDSFSRLVEEFVPADREERRVILAIPAGQIGMRELELPLSDRRKVRELLPLELKGETAVDADELVFDALTLDGGKVLAVWAKRHAVENLIGVMTETGMEPEMVTASLFSWQHLIPAEAASGTVAVTDGEALAVYNNGKPLYFRALAAGDPDAEVAKTLAALEIGKGIVVDRVFSHGGHSQKDAVSAEHAGEKVSSFPPLPLDGKFLETFAADADAARDLAGTYAIARDVTAGDPVNLRSGALAYTAGQAKALKKLRLSMFLAAGFVILLFAEVGLRYYLAKKDVDSLNNSIKAIYREVFPTRKKPVDEVAELRAEIKRLNSGKTTSNVLAVLKKVAEAKGDDVFGVYEAEIDGNQVLLKGDARSIQAVNDFKLRAADVLSDAEVGEIKSRTDGSVTFVLRGTVKEGEK